MSIQERWGKRELEKQFRQALFERTVLHPPKLSTLLPTLAFIGNTTAKS